MDISVEKIEKQATDLKVGDEIELGKTKYLINRIEKRERDMVFYTIELDDNLKHTSRATLVIPKNCTVTTFEVVIKP